MESGASVRSAESADWEDVNKSSLLISCEEGCEPPKKIHYKPGQPIERLCAQPLEPSPSGAEPK
jgi:hypothetical protein